MYAPEIYLSHCEKKWVDLEFISTTIIKIKITEIPLKKAQYRNAVNPNVPLTKLKQNIFLNCFVALQWYNPLNKVILVEDFRD